MRLLLAVGVTNEAIQPILAILREAGDVRSAVVAERPGRQDLDAVLDRHRGSDLVVMGTDPGLNAAVERLLRRADLPATPVGIVALPGSAVAAALGVPADPVAAARTAAGGRPVRGGLVRDDHGGVVLARATLRPTEGGGFGARAYVEDTEVANHVVRELAVRPVAGAVEVAVTARRPLARTRRERGRAATVNCAPARLAVDGFEHPRPQVRRTWWYEPDRLTVIRS